MPFVEEGALRLHWCESGDPAGAPVVFAHALGTDLTLWEGVLPLLPPGLRLIRFDLRGHGRSSCPPAPYAMGALVRDAERVIEAAGARDCTFVGVSLGGLVAQGIAVKRLDLVRALVLSNTAVKIATPQIWAERIAAVRQGGTAAIAEANAERWFPRAFRTSAAARHWRALVEATPPEGYAGACAAIAGADFLTPTSGLRLPALVIAGSEDGSTPPDLVRELAGLIPGAEFALIRGAGHLPMVDHPEDFAARLGAFLRATGQC